MDLYYLMTIFHALLMRGHFPKELPPACFTEQFARYATTRGGRTTLASYKPGDNFTECVKYQIALPGSHRREPRIPHPASFAHLAEITAKNFRRILTRSGRSPFAKSRPVYPTRHQRALRPCNVILARAFPLPAKPSHNADHTTSNSAFHPKFNKLRCWLSAPEPAFALFWT